jgi:hypothetical protein
MKNTLAIVALFMLFSFTSFAQDDKAYENKLSEMFEISGSEATFSAAINQMLGMYKSQKTNVPNEVWDELEKEFLQTSMTDLVIMLVPVYKKHLTLTDVEGLITFYKSPVGQKFAKKTPIITQESMQVGQQWGMAIGQKFAEKMKEKGY